MEKQNFLKNIKSLYRSIFSKEKNYEAKEEKLELKKDYDTNTIYNFKKNQYLKQWKDLVTQEELNDYLKEYSTKFLKNLPEEFRNDKDIMLQCIRSNADNLKYASSDLKNDKEFILNILKNNGAFILSGGEECDGAHCLNLHMC